jgi:hypothetical protein
LFDKHGIEIIKREIFTEIDDDNFDYIPNIQDAMPNMNLLN